VSQACCWDFIDPSELSCSEWNEWPQEVRDSALWLASHHLWSATGRQYGPCPITVYPSQNQVHDPAYRSYPVWPGQDPAVSGPYLFNGQWRNQGDGCGSGCCGREECSIVLRGPVHSVVEVQIGDEVTPSGSYRVDISQGAYRLVRTDGRCWPTCQGVEEFAVTYRQGRDLPEPLKIATAILACEYAKGLSGGNCRLPAKMTRLSRQGVELEVEPADPGNGMTGITEIDTVILDLNPSRRASPPRIWSPDLPESCDRVTVISPGGS
jgi:hypothetical protein